MIQMTFAETATLLDNHKSALSGNFAGISIDSRSLQPGNLFIAIQGEHLDGHQFIPEAIQKGASALVVKHPVAHPLPQFIVKDTDTAFATLAAQWRSQFDIPFIGVTGSNGKTTVKNMIASILVAACGGKTSEILAPKGTFNNHWGVPLTLARLNKLHRYAVIEMGMNHFGEIEKLTLLTRPQVALITNAASSHLEGVGDVAGVARAKAEIFQGLPAKGVAVLNRDDAFYGYWRKHIATHRCLSFGFHPEADIRATLQRASNTQHLSLHTPLGSIDVHLPLLGSHNVKNALAAVAATQSIGIDLDAIAAGLNSVATEKGRLQIHTLREGVYLIDDTYNANPFSLEAALKALVHFEGKKILVLGDMKELGKDAIQIHQAVGEMIRHAGIHTLFTYGELTAHTAKSFGESAFHFQTQQKLIKALQPFLAEEATILVKGSRSMHMENIVSAFLSSPPAGDKLA